MNILRVSFFVVLLTAALICKADETSDKEEGTGEEDNKKEEVLESEVDVVTTEINNPPTTAETSREEKEEDPETTTAQKEEGELGEIGGDREEETTTEEARTTTEAEEEEEEKKLSEQVREALAIYRAEGRLRPPGKPLPDPLYLPDINRKFAGSPANFTTLALFGLSDFEVSHINTDLDKMQVFVELKMRRLVLLGNYSMRSWLGRGSGPFNVTLITVTVSASAQLVNHPDGHLHASDLEMDMDFYDTEVDFKNTGVLGSLLQGVIGSAGPILFEAIKPMVMKEINGKIKADVNKRMKLVGNQLGEAKPLDKAVLEGRKAVKDMGYDPYTLDWYTVEKGPLRINITNLVLEGLSRFYRVGEVSLSMDSGTVTLGGHLATDPVTGSCSWVLAFNNQSHQGTTRFNISRIQARTSLNQSLDLEQKPRLQDLDLHFDKMRVNITVDGDEKMAALLQAAINALPDIIKHILVDALEEPIKERAQLLLNEVDMKSFVEKKIQALEEMGF